MADEQGKSTWSDRVGSVFTQRHPMLGALLDTDESTRMYEDRQRARRMESEKERALRFANENAVNTEARARETHALNMQRGQLAIDAARQEMSQGAERFQAWREENKLKKRVQEDSLFAQDVNKAVQGFTDGIADQSRAKVLGNSIRGVATLQVINKLIPQAMKELEQPHGSPTPTVDLIVRNVAASGFDLSLDKNSNIVVTDLLKGKTYTMPPNNWKQFSELAEERAQELRSMARAGDPSVGVGNTGYNARNAMEQTLGGGNLTESAMVEADKLYKHFYNTDRQALTIFSLLKSYEDAKRLEGPIGEQLRINMVDDLKSIGITATERGDGMGYCFYNPNRVYGLRDYYENADEFFHDLSKLDKVTPVVQTKKVQLEKAAEYEAKRKTAEQVKLFAQAREAEAKARIAEGKAAGAAGAAGGNGQPGTGWQGGASLSPAQSRVMVKHVVPDFGKMSRKGQELVDQEMVQINNILEQTRILQVDKDGNLSINKNSGVTIGTLKQAKSDIEAHLTQIKKICENEGVPFKEKMVRHGRVVGQFFQTTAKSNGFPIIQLLDEQINQREFDNKTAERKDVFAKENVPSLKEMRGIVASLSRDDQEKFASLSVNPDMWYWQLKNMDHVPQALMETAERRAKWAKKNGRETSPNARRQRKQEIDRARNESLTRLGPLLPST